MNTKKHNIKYALLLGCMSGFIIASKPALAVECGSCVTATQIDGSETRTALSTGLSTLQTSISAQLLSLQKMMSNLISTQTGAVTDQIAKSGTQQSEQAQQVAQATLKSSIAQSIGSPSSIAQQCNSTVSALTPRGGGTSSAGTVTFKPANIDKRLIDANNVAGKTGTPQIPPVEPQYQQSDLGVGSCKTFADPNSARGMMCKEAGAPGTGMNQYLDADIIAGTLIDGPQLKGQAPKVNRSTPLSGPERDARESLITNLTAASPPPSPPSQAMKSPEATAYLGLKVEYDAAMSLAAYPINDYNRMTTIDPATLDAVNKIKSAEPGFVTRYFNGVDPKFYATGVSPLTLIDLEVERRTGNMDWFKKLAGMDTTERQLEQVVMQAYQLRLQNLQLQASYKTNILLGKMLNMHVEATYKPKMERAIDSLNSAAVNRSSGKQNSTSSQ